MPSAHTKTAQHRAATRLKHAPIFTHEIVGRDSQRVARVRAAAEADRAREPERRALLAATARRQIAAQHIPERAPAEEE